MRVIAGSLRGRRLECPSGLALRPTSDRLKESLFNILSPLVGGSRFLDLFSGTGAIGIEAFSRGARRVVMVEKEALALRSLQANVRKCRLEEEVSVISLSAEIAIPRLAGRAESFDLIFLDPPYRQEDLYPETLQQIESSGILSEDGLVVAEHPARTTLAENYGNLYCFRRHLVGDSGLSFYRCDLSVFPRKPGTSG